MSPTDAQHIIDKLAEGVDPETGEILPPDSPLSSPNVIRALFTASRGLRLLSAVTSKEQRKKKREAAAHKSDPGPAMAGKPWTEEEDEEVIRAFDAGASLAELAAAHSRKPGGIESRLKRHGRLFPVPASMMTGLQTSQHSGIEMKS